MTRNQLTYWQNVETERSNKANEAELLRSNIARERETYRSNVAKEQENLRHNLATEQYYTQLLEETKRANLARESQEVANLAERTRAAIASETIGLLNLQIGLANAETNRMNTTVSAFQAYTNASQGQQRLQEQERSNRANERVALMNVGELARFHDQSYSIALGNLSETNRANLAKQEEITRSNLAAEQLKRDQITLDELAQSQRFNIDSQNASIRRYEAQTQRQAVAENKRHNLALEPSQITANESSTWKVLGRLLPTSVNESAYLK